jgi:hypothetical protein
MGLWVREPRIEDGETVTHRWAANHSRGRWAIGGRLFLTDRRLIFVPTILDRLMGQRDWACTLAEIRECGPPERTLKNPMSVGIRRRLALRLRDGRDAYFVVDRLEEKVVTLGFAREQAPP